MSERLVAILALAGALALWAWVLGRLAWRPASRRRWLATIALLACVPPSLAGLSTTGLFELGVLRLERPWLALPAAVLVLAALARLERLSPRQAPFRRSSTEALSAVTLLAASLALVGVELGRPLDRLSILVALDRSRSIDLVPNAESRIATELRVAELGMREDDRIGTLAFGTAAAVEDPLRPRTRLPAPQRAEVGRDGTDLGVAIRHALGEL